MHQPTSSTVMNNLYGDRSVAADKPSFWKLRKRNFVILRWKSHASVYYIVSGALVCYLTAYYSISAVYRHVMNEEQQIKFETFTHNLSRYDNYIPVSFVLAFYVGQMYSRWWGIFNQIPWPDNVATQVLLYVKGKGPEATAMRRNLVRYVLQSEALTYYAVGKRFRQEHVDIKSLIHRGVFTSEEAKMLRDHPFAEDKYWLPSVWFTTLLREARDMGYVESDYNMNALMTANSAHRGQCGMLMAYDWIGVPLCYRQVVAVATYSYFAYTAVAHQNLLPREGDAGHAEQYHIPFFTVIQLIIYVGWLKVAENMTHPFRGGAEAFDLVYILNRNIDFAHAVIDAHGYMPTFNHDPAPEVTLEPCPPRVTDAYYRLFFKKHFTEKASQVYRSYSEADEEEDLLKPMTTRGAYGAADDYEDRSRRAADSGALMR